MRCLIVLLVLFSTSSGWAADATVRDGDTLSLAGVTYRLDGIDAPEFDQICIDDQAEPWTCGIEARDQLAKLIGGRGVHCEDLGPDRGFNKWHIGVCSVEGETISLNQMLVRQGFALNAAASGKARFGEDEAGAKAKVSGLWKGCFVAPQDFRQERKTAALLGAACRNDKDREIRAVLFPDEPAMPPNCSVKAKLAVRAHVTGHVGVYHLQSCSTYAPVTKPDRWFCSEEDAQAAGYRKAYNCRPSVRRK
jgi:endonuclease YncB( thermonuclease family)